MYCHNCGARVKDGAKFCFSCGAQQASAVPSVITEIICPSCGEKLEPDSVFCEECGHKLTRAGTQLQTAKSKMPKSKKQNRNLPSLIILSVLSVLLVIVIGSVIWKNNTDKPRRSKDKDTETNVTETRRRRETEHSETAEITESEKSKESVNGNETTEDPSIEQTSEPGLIRDPARYNTSDMSKMADFQWITYEIMYGYVPDDVELLNNAQEIAGGWKAYIVDDYSGENSVYIERLCNCYISGTSQDLEVCIRWDYLFNGSTNESYSEKDYQASYFNGSWSDGSLYATGSGSITFSGFWYKDGKEYALGTMTWVDGLTSTVYLVRP